jgi:hypothetical protein
MKTITLNSLIIFICILIVSSEITYAGRFDKAGTAGATQLLIPVGARDLALGGSSLATTSGVDAIFWNPAGLPRSDYGASAMFSHMSYLADIGVEYVAVATNVGDFGSLGFSLKSINIGEIKETTEESPDGTGAIITPTFVTVGVTYAKNLADNISVGITGNLISEQMDRVSQSGIAFNAGVQYHGLANVPGLSLGIALKNIGPQLKYGGPGLLRPGSLTNENRGPSLYSLNAAGFELPSTIEMGLSYYSRFSDQNSLVLSSTFQNNNFYADEYKLGAEYNFENTLWLRGGYNFSQDGTLGSLPSSDKTAYIYGPTFGFGVNQELGEMNISVDYAYRSVEFFDANHMFTVRLGF